MARNFTNLNGSTQYYSVATGLNLGGITEFEIEFLLQTNSAVEQWIFSDWDEATSDRSFGVRLSGGSVQVFSSNDGIAVTGSIDITAA